MRAVRMVVIRVVVLMWVRVVNAGSGDGTGGGDSVVGGGGDGVNVGGGGSGGGVGGGSSSGSREQSHLAVL